MTLQVKANDAWSAVGGAVTEPWVRPADWLAMPTIVDGDDIFAGLHAVWPGDSNFVALSAAGNYTVDWGDGTVENYSANAVAEHNILWANVSSDTLTTSGYRQALVVVTLQQGQTFSGINLQQFHPQTVPGYTPGWLDIALAGQDLVDIVLSNPFSGAGLQQMMLQRFRFIGSTTFTNADNLLRYSPSLRVVEIDDMTHVTTAASMFTSCFTLTDIVFNQPPLALQSTVSMFSGCYALKTSPLFDTSAVTDMSGMYSGCYSLTTVPDYDTASVTNMGSMFNNCYSLMEIPSFNTANVTSMLMMFNSCFSMVTAPSLNTSKVTNTSNMFSNCYALRSVPAYDTSKVTNSSYMFNSCYALDAIPLIDTRAVTNAASMFSACTALRHVPALDFSACTASTSLSNIFSACSNLQSCDITGVKVNISFSGCNLSAAALNTIYTNLASGVTSKNIIVGPNQGAAASNTTIATSKGWTVKDTPTAPTITGIVAQVRYALDIVFTAPANTGGAITNYEYAFSSDPTNFFLVSPADATSPVRTAANLPDNTSYKVRIRARNANGVGMPSLWFTGTTAGIPAKPTATVVPDYNYAVLTITSPIPIPITQWEYKLDDGPWVVATGAYGTDILVDNDASLTYGTQYTVRLRATNSFGTGPESDPYVFTTLA